MESAGTASNRAFLSKITAVVVQPFAVPSCTLDSRHTIPTVADIYVRKSIISSGMEWLVSRYPINLARTILSMTLNMQWVNPIGQNDGNEVGVSPGF